MTKAEQIAEMFGNDGQCFIARGEYLDCIAAGDRWMSLDRETQLAMMTKPDYQKFV